MSTPLIRTGYASVLVLLTIMLVTGLCLAMLQATKSNILLQRNEEIGWRAENNAEVGFEHALHRMTLPDWSGPDSDYSFQIDDHSGFDVAYAYEDSLESDDPNYWLQPYMVRLSVVGYCTLNSRKTQFEISAKVILNDVTLNSDKDAFSDAPDHALTIASPALFAKLFPPTLDFWNRIDGTSSSYSGFKLWDTIDSDSRVAFLNEMNAGTFAGSAPLVGTAKVVDSNIYASFADAISILSIDLFQASNLVSGIKYSVGPSKYQIYTGGPVYSIPTLASQLKDTTLEPSLENPLGIFRGYANTTLKKDCRIEGTIVMGRGLSLTVTEKDTAIGQRSIVLPDGSTFVLPTILADRLVVQADEDIAVDGAVIADSTVTVEPQSNKAHVSFAGWVYCDYCWLRTYDPDKNNTGERDTENLTTYVEDCNLPDLPYCTIKATSLSNLHWQDLSRPILIPTASANGGYRWKVLEKNTRGFL